MNCGKKSHNICIVALVTDDIFFRIYPICCFLSRRYCHVTILLFDQYRGRYSFDHIVEAFKGKGYDVRSFTTVREGLNLMKNFKQSDFLYLIKHCHINYKLLSLYLLYILNRSASGKKLSRCNILVIRKTLANKVSSRREHLISACLIMKNSILHYLAYVLNVLVYLTIFHPLCSSIKDSRLGGKLPRSESGFRNILFIKMDHLGDVVASLLSLSALRVEFPGSKISVLAAEWGTDGFKIAEDLYDELIVWKPPWHDKRSIYYNKDVLGFLKLIKFFKFVYRLRRKHFDLVIQPRGEGMNVVTAALLRADTIVSCISPQRPLAMLMRRWISIPLLLNPYRTYHISEWSKLCLEKINVQVPPDTLSRFRGCSDEGAEHPELVKDIEVWRSKGFKICGLGISAGSVVRLWSPRKFDKLIDRLYRESIICVLIGSESDKSIRDQISASATYVDIVGKTNFRDLKKIVNDVDLVVTLDTSLAHLASLLGKKTVTLFGAGNLELSKPVFNESCAILKKELGCSGCGDICLFSKRLSKKQQAPCMDLISVESVMNEIRKVL